MNEIPALRALLEAVPILSGSVRDSAVASDGTVVRGNYLVLFGAGPEELDDKRWCMVPQPDSDAVFEVPLRGVAVTPELVLRVADGVRQIVGRKPVVAGRRCDPVVAQFDAVKQDTSVAPPLYFMDMWVRFTSRRA